MRRSIVLVVVLAALAGHVPAARADANPFDSIELYGVRMDPEGNDASRFARPGWGGGIETTMPLPGTGRTFAAVLGIEAVNLLSRTEKLVEPATGLRLEQRTTQNYGRLFVGAQFGSHSSGFLRPYVGANLAGVWYGIGSELVIPDDQNPDNSVHQQRYSESRVVFGWDANSGVNLNFSDRWNLDFGVRYVHGYGVPQQLGHDAVRIEPGYVQYRAGIGLGRRTLGGSPR